MSHVAILQVQLLTPLSEKMARPLGLWLKLRHFLLFVVHLE